MKYLLDTNACIVHLRSSPSSALTRHLADLEPDSVVLCSVVKAELAYGALLSRNTDLNRRQLEQFFAGFISVPFDDRAAEVYGQIRSQLTRAGTPIGPNDLMIAAIALANDLTLVTHNISEFKRISGLKVEDWET